jgi:hypothetical protein
MLVRLVLGLVFVAAIGGGGAYVAVQQKPSVAAGLKPVITSTQAAKSFDEKVKSLQAAADEAKKSGKATPVEVTFSEEELTSKVNETSASITGGLAATDTQIHLSGGNIVATSKVNVQGIDLNLGVVAKPVVENGQTKVIIQEIQTGALPIPDALKQQLQTQVGQAVDPRSLGLPFDVSQVKIVDGKIVIAGTAKP